MATSRGNPTERKLGNEPPRGKPRGIYRKLPKTLRSIEHLIVKAWSAGSITFESQRIPDVLGARQAAGYGPERNQLYSRGVPISAGS
jgi:hypothetical protein